MKNAKSPSNILEAIDYYMELGYPEEIAERFASMEFDPNYCADDYDA